MNMQSTFWRSPYTGDNTFFRNNVSGSRSLYLKPELTVSQPKLRPKLGPMSFKPVTVRSILKHKDDTVEATVKGESGNDAVSEGPTTPRIGYGKPNLITTGTGAGRSHGAKERVKTAEKKVKFDNSSVLTNYSSKPYSGFRNIGPDRTTGFTQSANKRNRTRSLGSIEISNLASKNGNIATINDVDTNIKSQISAFVRKLRLAEIERTAKFEESVRMGSIDQRRRAREKLQKNRCYSAGKTFFDWNEYDIEKTNGVRKNAGNDSKDSEITADVNQSRVEEENNSSTLESFESFSDNDVTENTQGGVKIIRPMPNASLFTKYRHITSNNVQIYGCKTRSARDDARASSSMSRDSMTANNYCDSAKTDQILGWLEGVENAQINAGTIH